jgi:hypothetical protein
MKKTTISENIHHYLMKHNGNEEKMKDFSEFIEAFFCDMEEEYAEVKTGFYAELEDFTDELDEEMLHELVAAFKRKDGTVSRCKMVFGRS